MGCGDSKEKTSNKVSNFTFFSAISTFLVKFLRCQMVCTWKIPCKKNLTICIFGSSHYFIASKFQLVIVLYFPHWDAWCFYNLEWQDLNLKPLSKNLYFSQLLATKVTFLTHFRSLLRKQPRKSTTIAWQSLKKLMMVWHLSTLRSQLRK